MSRVFPARPALALKLAVPDIERENRADGSFVLRSRTALRAFDRSPVDWLVKWASATPDAPFLAERERDSAGAQGVRWRVLSYRQVLTAVRAIGQALIDLRMPPERPVVVLSDNSVNHALLSLATMYAGRRSASVSPAYARVAKDMTKLHGILNRLAPGLVYAEEGEAYRQALDGAPIDCPMVATHSLPPGWLSFDSLLRHRPGTAVDDAFHALAPGNVAKLLLTSGSTGHPKLVINTHAMLAANQQMVAQCWPFLEETPPILVDWLPWSHTFGANHNFNLVLRNGGVLYIDDGRPVPGLIERSVENLRDVAPTLHFNVPKGFDALAPFLDADSHFAERFFSRLQAVFYAAAALPTVLWERFEHAAMRHRSDALFFTSAWGSTETSPLVTSLHFQHEGAGNVGVPAPGNELKFVPNAGKLELRVRGPSVFPGYLGDTLATQAAFDDEGFYRIGDAGMLCVPEDPNHGVLFDGRVAEDFKLLSGTWVSVGALRLKALTALAPYAADVVVAGHDRDQIGLLIFAAPPLIELLDAHGARRGHDAIRAGLRRLAEDAPSSQRAACAIVLNRPPSLEAGEITDKGYINQRAVLNLRGEDVERLFSDHETVIHLS
jgi:feruloyl-CoA synthase